MTHDYHEGLPDYNEAQILHDGCIECEQRAAEPYLGITSLDVVSFQAAWRRAAAWTRGRLNDAQHTVSAAERPMLAALWAVQVQLDRAGISLLGELPLGLKQYGP